MKWCILALTLAGCGQPTGTACSDSDACAIVGLSFCTSELGDRAPHAFCTQKCDDDTACDVGNECAPVPWLHDATHVCVPSEWLRLWNK